MKITVSRETFLDRLGIVARGTSARSAIQALSGVLLNFADGKSELQATDADLGIRAGLAAEVATPGAVVVPGRLLLDVVRSLSADTIVLEHRQSEQDVEVSGGSATFHLRTLPLEDFPLSYRPISVIEPSHPYILASVSDGDLRLFERGQRPGVAVADEVLGVEPA